MRTISAEVPGETALMVRTALLLILGITIAGCSGGSDEPSDTMKFVAAREAVSAQLRDPDSAAFRSERLRSYQGRQVVCGEVNSANAFGGKAGFQRFVTNGAEATVLEEQMTPDEFAAVWTTMGC